MIDSMLNYDSTRAFDRPTVASRPAPAPKPPTPVKARQNSYKLMMGVNGGIYLEVTGDNDTRSSDLVSFTRKLDLKTLKKLK